MQFGTIIKLALGGLIISCLGFVVIKKLDNAFINPFSNKPPVNELPKERKSLIAVQRISEAKKFVSDKKYNQQYCFLIDTSLPSGSNRFFIYDLKKDSIIDAGLVAHGNCNLYWLEGRKYGNTVGCGCTSLGKYKTGKPYHGRFGLAYKLYGMEQTNDKAFDRFVVLHSHACVPASEIKDDICQSNGCPMVNPVFLGRLQTLLDKSSRPILLWIYN